MTGKLDRLTEKQKSTLLTINCRGCVGGDCFLIKGNGANILVDSGFAFCVAEAIKSLSAHLDGEGLDYILLTHSHYDHAMGIPALRKAFPNVKVIGSEYCNYILTKPSARKKMQDMDDMAAKAYGHGKSDDVTEGLYCDIILKDGDEIQLGDEPVRAVALAGHTKCCMGYFFTKERMLVSCETLGIYADESIVFPGCLIGYQMTVDAIDRALALNAKEILIPHSGYLYGEDIENYLNASKKATDECRELILEAHRKGMDFDSIVAEYKKKYYCEKISKSYPEHALMANLSAQIPMFINECGKGI